MSDVEDRLLQQLNDLDVRANRAEFWRDAFDRALHDARQLAAKSDCRYAVAAVRRITETLAAYDKHINANLGRER